METDSDMLVQSKRFLLHSSRAHIRTGTARKYGRSETTATALLSSDSHTGTLKSAMKWASRRRDDGSGGQRPSEEVLYGQQGWSMRGLGGNAPVRRCCIDSRGG